MLKKAILVFLILLPVFLLAQDNFININSTSLINKTVNKAVFRKNSGQYDKEILYRINPF